MNFCPRCGNPMPDGNGVCQNCGWYDSGEIIEGEVIKETTERIEPDPNTPPHVDLSKNTHKEHSFYGRNGSFFYSSGSGPDNGKELPAFIKILLVMASILLPGIGPIFAIICGVILMGDGSQNYRSFGIGMLMLGIVLTIFSILCCIMNMATGIISSIFFFWL